VGVAGAMELHSVIRFAVPNYDGYRIFGLQCNIAKRTVGQCQMLGGEQRIGFDNSPVFSRVRRIIFGMRCTR
jgi:hypothetical protein